MAQILVTAEKTVNAPADTVFGYVRDMQEHPNFLPPAFSDFQVESGGVGPGTITRFTVTAGGRSRNYRMKVDEPEPGRIITESDTGSSLVTKTTVTPRAGGISHVEIATTWQARAASAASSSARSRPGRCAPSTRTNSSGSTTTPASARVPESARLPRAGRFVISAGSLGSGDVDPGLIASQLTARHQSARSPLRSTSR